MTPEYYLSLLTMHGTLMVFFVLTNAPFAAFGSSAARVLVVAVKIAIAANTRVRMCSSN